MSILVDEKVDVDVQTMRKPKKQRKINENETNNNKNICQKIPWFIWNTNLLTLVCLLSCYFINY